MAQIKIIFNCESKVTEMFFPENIVIEDALLQYLKVTNSKLYLSIENIIFLYNARILNDKKYLKMTLNELGMEYNDIIVVKKMKDLSYSYEGETILIIFQDNRYSNTISKSFPKSTLIKDALTKYLNETNSILDLSSDKIAFIYNGRILNSERYLSKTLSDLKINNNSMIKINGTREVVGGFY